MSLEWLVVIVLLMITFAYCVGHIDMTPAAKNVIFIVLAVVVLFMLFQAWPVRVLR